MFKPAEGLRKIDNKQPSVIQASSVRDRNGAAFWSLASMRGVGFLAMKKALDGDNTG
jgi:hypothetical protein